MFSTSEKKVKKKYVDADYPEVSILGTRQSMQSKWSSRRLSGLDKTGFGPLKISFHISLGNIQLLHLPGICLV